MTRFPSLELGIERGAQAGNCDSGYSCAYSSNISWRSATTPMAKEINPRLVFERLFANEVDGGPHLAKRRRYKQSILDFVAEDAGRLQARLGSTDRRKIDEYLTSVREIEIRVANAGKPIDLDLSDYERPTGVPADHQEHIRLMCDLMVLAFQADVTRIATFMFANEGSNRSYPMIGVPEGHHDLSHHGNDPKKQDEDPEDQPLPRDPARLLPRQAEVDPRRRRHAPRPLHDRLRQRHRRRQPPQPRRPADPPGRPGRRHDPDRPPRQARHADAVEQPLSLDARPDGRPRRPLGDSTGKLSGLSS